MMFMFPCDSTPNVRTALKALLPPDRAKGPDNEYDLFDRLYREEPPPTNWPHCIGLPLWIVSLGLLFYQVTCSQVTCSRKLRPEASS
jgi:hypothetical protein